MRTYRRKYTITIGDFIVKNSNIPVIKKEEPENIVLTLNTALDLKNYLDKHFFGDFNYCYKENRKGELTKIGFHNYCCWDTKKFKPNDIINAKVEIKYIPYRMTLKELSEYSDSTLAIQYIKQEYNKTVDEIIMEVN